MIFYILNILYLVIKYNIILITMVNGVSAMTLSIKVTDQAWHLVQPKLSHLFQFIPISFEIFPHILGNSLFCSGLQMTGYYYWRGERSTGLTSATSAFILSILSSYEVIEGGLFRMTPFLPYTGLGLRDSEVQAEPILVYLNISTSVLQHQSEVGSTLIGPDHRESVFLFFGLHYAPTKVAVIKTHLTPFCELYSDPSIIIIAIIVVEDNTRILNRIIINTKNT